MSRHSTRWILFRNIVHVVGKLQFALLQYTLEKQLQFALESYYILRWLFYYQCCYIFRRFLLHFGLISHSVLITTFSLRNSIIVTDQRSNQGGTRPSQSVIQANRVLLRVCSPNKSSFYLNSLCTFTHNVIYHFANKHQKNQLITQLWFWQPEINMGIFVQLIMTGYDLLLSPPTYVRGHLMHVFA